MKKSLGYLFLVLFTIDSIEIVSYFGLDILKRIKEIHYAPIEYKAISDRHRDLIAGFIKNNSRIIYSPKSGWTHRKNSPNHEFNSDGLRSPREYNIRPPSNTIRISTFGDSFTYCSDVNLQDSWQEKMMKKNPHLEVLNFGVSAYGLDQAYLRYLEDGKKYYSDIVFIGFMPENIYRMPNVFRPFYFPGTGLPFVKPRFIIKGSKLHKVKGPIKKLSDYQKLLDSPEKMLPLLGENDHYFNLESYQPSAFDFLSTVKLIKILSTKVAKKLRKPFYHPESNTFKITTKVFDQFVDEVKKQGSIPIIVILPQNLDVIWYREGKPERYQHLVKYFDQKKYHYIDVLNAFKNNKNKIEELFISHYSPLANEIVSDYILQYINKTKLIALKSSQ